MGKHNSDAPDSFEIDRDGKAIAFDAQPSHVLVSMIPDQMRLTRDEVRTLRDWINRYLGEPDVVEVLNISPAMAGAMLGRNTTNRPMNDEVIARQARDIERHDSDTPPTLRDAVSALLAIVNIVTQYERKDIPIERWIELQKARNFARHALRAAGNLESS